MEFSLRVGDMSFFVFCKFEIVIFKIVQVMTENIPFAFLYVLSIGIEQRQLQAHYLYKTTLKHIHKCSSKFHLSQVNSYSAIWSMRFM